MMDEDDDSNELEDDDEMSSSPEDDEEGNGSGEMLAGQALKMARQKTVDPSKMGNIQGMKAMLDESGNELMDGLTLKAQKSAKQSEHLKSSNRKKHNRRTAKEINR